MRLLPPDSRPRKAGPRSPASQLRRSSHGRTRLLSPPPTSRRRRFVRGRPGRCDAARRDRFRPSICVYRSSLFWRRNVGRAKINRFQRFDIGDFVTLAGDFRQSPRGWIRQFHLRELRQLFRRIDRDGQFFEARFQLRFRFEDRSFDDTTTFNLGEEERLPARVTDRAIVLRFYVERADGRNPDKLCPDCGTKAEPRRDGDAHTGIGTRSSTHHNFLRLAEAFQTELHIFKKSARMFSIGRKTDVEQSYAVITP